MPIGVFRRETPALEAASACELGPSDPEPSASLCNPEALRMECASHSSSARAASAASVIASLPPSEPSCCDEAESASRCASGELGGDARALAAA